MGLATMIKDELRRRVVDPAIEARLDELPNRLNEYGYDAWGFHPEWAKWGASVMKHLYQKWFRVETYGIEHVPAGRVLLIANHSGQLPLDGAMIGMSLALEGKPPRAVRAMVERWFPTLPFISPLFYRMGQVVGTRQNCERLLENDEAVLVFPEGVRGSGKVIFERYTLKKFGHGFLRLALKTGTPIVPVAVVGAEETYPSILNAKLLAKLLGFPYFPITPFFPLLGPLGALPLPVKIRLYFDEPIWFDGDPDAPDEVLAEKVEVVKGAIRKLIEYGLESREGLFT